MSGICAYRRRYTCCGRLARTRYKWELANTAAQDGYTFYALRLTSQTWLTPAEVDVNVWTRTSPPKSPTVPPVFPVLLMERAGGVRRRAQTGCECNLLCLRCRVRGETRG